MNDSINNNQQSRTIDILNQKKGITKNQKTNKINRGFKNDNSVSKQNKENILKSTNFSKPKIDTPEVLVSNQEHAREEIMSFVSSLQKGGDDAIKNFLKGINKNELKQKMLNKESETLINGGTNLLNKDKDLSENNKKVANSATNIEKNITEKKQLNSKQDIEALNKLAKTYFDVAEKFYRIKVAPVELIEEITDDFIQLSKLISDNPKLDVEAAAIALASIQMKLIDSRIQIEQKDIKSQQIEKERLANKEMKQILESIEKAKEAQKSGGVGKILGYIGAAFMGVVAGVMIAGAVFTGGTTAIAAAVLITIATSLVLAMQVSQETGGWMLEIFGSDNKLAAQIFWTALILVLSIASLGASSAAAAGNAASSASKLVIMGDKVIKGSQAAAGLTSIGGGVAGAVAADQNYKASMLAAESKLTRAQYLLVVLFMEENQEKLEKAIKAMQQPIVTFSEIIESTSESKSEALRKNG